MIVSTVFEYVDLVNTLMMGEYPDEAYKGWLKINATDCGGLIIEKAAQYHCWDMEDILDRMLKDMEILNADLKIGE